MSTAVITMIEREKIELINREHSLCAAAYGTALVHAINCGRMLAAVKSDLQHGEWLPWVEEHFDGSERTARVYMQLADSPELQDRQSAADLPASMSAALKEITKPRATAQRPSSPRTAVGMVAGMEDDEHDQRALPAGADTAARFDQAHDRLREQASSPWTEQHSARRRRILALLDQARDGLDRASDQGLNPHAVAERLRDAEIKTRQASAQLGDLAFTFER